MIKVATVILENPKGEILIHLRDNKPTIPFPNHWDLFGGRVEKGETPEQAMLREVKEEIGYNLKEYHFFKKYRVNTGDAHPNIKYVYIGKINKPLGRITLYEGQKLRFVQKEEIPNIKFANVLKDILIDYMRK